MLDRDDVQRIMFAASFGQGYNCRHATAAVQEYLFFSVLACIRPLRVTVSFSKVTTSLMTCPFCLFFLSRVWLDWGVVE